MDTKTQPPDLTLQLPWDVYYQLIHTVRDALPPISDTPEDLARRDNAAIALIASLLPANADEANLASQYVGASAHATECLRLALAHRGDPAVFLKFDAQADRMQRQARGFRALLQRVQAERRKRETDSAATDRAAWTEHCAIGLMADALGRTPPAAAAAVAEPAPAQRAEEPALAEDRQSDPIAEAEQYAVIYPERAALIRRLGRVPDDVSFGPPDEVLVRALVSGQTSVLLALDRQAPEPRAG